MMPILEFIFQDFVHFAGSLLLLIVSSAIFAQAVDVLRDCR